MNFENKALMMAKMLEDEYNWDILGTTDNYCPSCHKTYGAEEKYCSSCGSGLVLANGTAVKQLESCLQWLFGEAH